MLLEILVSAFALWAISRSWLRLKYGNESIGEFLFWSLIWITVIVVLFNPAITQIPADLFDIDRGIDAMVYLGLIILFYSVYRVYSKIERVEQDITSLTRYIALKDAGISRKHVKKTSSKKKISRSKARR